MILAADIGGTSTRVALGNVDGAIAEVKKFATPSSFDEGVALLIATMSELPKGQEIERAVIGIAGVLGDTGLTWSPHLPEWAGKDLKGALEAGLGVPVTLENDAALAALGEARLGAGTDFPIVAYVTIGTGIGGARVVDGAIDRSAHGFEIGHEYLSYDNETEFEQVVSGTAVAATHGVAAKDFKDEEAWRAYEKQLAHGLYNTLLHWSPNVLVLGGSLMRDDGMHVDGVVAELKRINKAIPQLPEVRRASLEYPGISGALIYS